MKLNTPVLAFLILLSVVFICLALTAKSRNWESVVGLFMNIAAGLVGAVITALVYPLFSRPRVVPDGPRPAKYTELLGVHAERPEEPNLWRDFLSSDDLPHGVDVMGKVLREVVERLEYERGKLLKKILNGCNIRILLIDPNGRAAKIRSEEEGGGGAVGKPLPEALPGAVASILYELPHPIPDILAESRYRRSNGSSRIGSFGLGIYDVTPLCSITKVGGRMSVTHYLCKEPGDLCPTFLFEDKAADKGLFSKYERHFQAVWESNRVKLLVFEIDSRFQTELDDRIVSPALRKEFSENHFFLSEHAEASIEQYLWIKERDNDHFWLITDGDKTFTVKKEEISRSKLSVYFHLVSKDSTRGN